MEVRCQKNGFTIRFEIPEGSEPIKYAKNKLTKMAGKRPYKWRYEILDAL